MKYYILLFISLFFIGCSTPRFYPEIASTYENYDTLVSKHGKEAVSKSSFDSHKLVMRKLSSYLKNSDHIIYHYSRTTRKWRGKEFSGVVYDVDNKKYYYFKNSEEHPRKLSVTENYPYPNDNYYKFVIDNFRKGRIDYLKKLGEASNLSGIRTTKVIYDINLRKGTNKRYNFRDFLFMNGKPTRDVEE